MGFGLFGKIPQKRDFISVNLPHAVLNPFETWLQSAVAASRNEIGRNWENYYLVAPIWRFWLGKDILGTACTGSLMPSVDQVGRYFPLAIMYWAEPGETLTPPLINPIDHWYRQIEDRMLAMLSDTPYEVGQILQGLAPPDYSAPPPVQRAAVPPPAFAEPSPAPIAPQEPDPEPVITAPEPEQPEQAAETPSPERAEETAPATLADETAPASGPDAWDVAADRALEEASESLAADARARTIPPSDGWMPEPMPADKLAELQNISAASFSPPPTAGGSLWDLPPGTSSRTNGSSTSSPWDMPAAAPAEEEAPRAEPIAVVGTPFVNTAPGAPMAVLSETPPAKASTAAAAPPAISSLAPPPDSPKSEPPPVVEAEPPPAAQPSPAPTFEPRISTGDFKGGMVAVIDGVNTMSEALPQLMAAEFAHFAQSRGYWWCGPSSSGGPQLFAKAGLPDPYFYTRMLMWQGN